MSVDIQEESLNYSMVSPLMGTLNTLNVNLVKCNGPD